MLPIIDCHVHMPPATDYPAAGERLLMHMRRHRIAMMIASDLGDGWRPFPDSVTLHNANRRLSELARRYAPQLQYLVYLNPQLPDWADELAAHASQAVGIKLWISLRASDGSFDRTIAVLHEAARLRLPVLIHTFHRTDANLPGEINLDDLIVLAEAAAECRILAAHAGGNWRAAIARRDRIPANVQFDFSGGYPERGMVGQLLAAFGPQRLLYGSDAPGRSFGSQLTKVLHSGFPETVVNALVHENACRLFNLGGAVAKLTRQNDFHDPESTGVSMLPDAAEDHFCFVGSQEGFGQRATLREWENELRKHRIRAAYTVDLQTLDAADRPAANHAWAVSCRRGSAVRPLAAVLPTDRRETLKQLEQSAGFAGIWISPYLGGFPLDDPGLDWFWTECETRGLDIWINCALADDRFRSAGLQRRVVDPAEIHRRMKRSPHCRCIVQGVSELADLTSQAPAGWRFEYSRLSDGEYLFEQFLSGGGDAGKLVCGSEYPFRECDAATNVLRGLI